MGLVEGHGWELGPDGETVLAIELAKTCPHLESCWEETSRGHSWCRNRGGHVDPRTRAVLTNGGPVLKCNRKRQPWRECSEWFTGSAALTTRMRKSLGAVAVRMGRNQEEGTRRGRMGVGPHRRTHIHALL